MLKEYTACSLCYLPLNFLGRKSQLQGHLYHISLELDFTSCHLQRPKPHQMVKASKCKRKSKKKPVIKTLLRYVLFSQFTGQRLKNK